METITRIAAFTGAPAVETAISERLWLTGDFIGEYGLTLPGGGTPPDGWPCAIFKPEADMYRFDLDCEGDGLLQDSDACGSYGLPEGTESAVYMILTGGRGEVEGFCQAVCDLAGMTCHVMENTEAGYVREKTLRSAKPAPSTCTAINLMFDPDD